MILLLFKKDLRIEDNPALNEAIKAGKPILPIYIHSQYKESFLSMGSASSWWLHHALSDLNNQLLERGLSLRIHQGDFKNILLDYINNIEITAIYFNKGYDPQSILEQNFLLDISCLKKMTVKSFSGNLLHDPDFIKNKTHQVFQVFTHFWKLCLTLPKEKPFTEDLDKIIPPSSHILDRCPSCMDLDELMLLPKIPWDVHFKKQWEPTQKGAQERLNIFIFKYLATYDTGRDRPDLDQTSTLSPFLHFGQLSVRQVWHAVANSIHSNTQGAYVYLSEIGWREFAYYLLYHFPYTAELPLRKKYQNFPWKEDSTALFSWKKGKTGYPIIDAGMQQLWQTGWMHNRVRMITGSFLVKHLLQPWQKGAEWFWDTLLDADLASNTLGWQWVSGCGADAAPYFRIFNPMLQGKKFDPVGQYIKKYLPVLQKLPVAYIHTPWLAPKNILEYAGIDLGKNYPMPIIEHDFARTRALSAFQSLNELNSL